MVISEKKSIALKWVCSDMMIKYKSENRQKEKSVYQFITWSWILYRSHKQIITSEVWTTCTITVSVYTNIMCPKTVKSNM